MPRRADQSLGRVFDRTAISNAAARIAVEIVKDNAATTAVSAGEGSVGGPVTLSKGAGAYTVKFHKTAAGSDDYDSIINCNPGGTPAGSPTVQLIQNQ